jgi:CheY-like chemotaxis protein
MQRILVAEDDPDIAALLRAALEDEGYAVETAVDGLAAWEAALELPAAILFDLAMPRMDGFELARRLRRDARTRAIPLVAVSAHEDLADAAAALGIDAAIAKPFDLDRLLGVVRRLAGEATPRRAGG